MKVKLIQVVTVIGYLAVTLDVTDKCLDIVDKGYELYHKIKKNQKKKK